MSSEQRRAHPSSRRISDSQGRRARRPTAVEPEAPRDDDDSALHCGFFAPCEQDADHDGPHMAGMYPEWTVPAIAPMWHVGSAVEPDGLPLDVLADALRDALSDEIVWRPILADDPWRYYAERVIASLTPTPAPPEARE